MSITEAEIERARTAWGEALIVISKAFDTVGIDAARTAAGNMLDAAYGYNLGPVLFKPTLASGAQTFRPTRDGALSYYVGHCDAYPLDIGFGTRGWRTVASDTAGHVLGGEVALWMGHVTITDRGGTIMKVDKTFGYKKDADGIVRIVLHHSSLPHKP
ncbi:MAG: phosphoribosyl-AMP cyclohydrolase [Pseudomonadota bacterium]